MLCVRPVSDEVVERGREFHGTCRCPLNLREHIRTSSVLVTSLHRRVQFVQRIVDTLHTTLEDRVDDVVDLLKTVLDKGIQVAVQDIIVRAGIELQLVEFEQCLVHTGTEDLQLLLLVTQLTLQVRITFAVLHLELI